MNLFEAETPEAVTDYRRVNKLKLNSDKPEMLMVGPASILQDSMSSIWDGVVLTLESKVQLGVDLTFGSPPG